MTRRSRTYTPKSTAISQRHRNHGEKNVSIRPPEVPRLRALRSRPVATLLSPRHISVNCQNENAEAHTTIYGPPVLQDPSTRSNIRDPSGVEQNAAASPSRDPNDLPSSNPNWAGLDFLLSSQVEARARETPSTTHNTPSRFPLFAASQFVPYQEVRLSTLTQQTNSTVLQQTYTPVGLQDMSTLDYMPMPAQYGLPYSQGPQGYPVDETYPHFPVQAQQQQHPTPTDSYPHGTSLTEDAPPDWKTRNVSSYPHSTSLSESGPPDWKSRDVPSYAPVTRSPYDEYTPNTEPPQTSIAYHTVPYAVALSLPGLSSLPLNTSYPGPSVILPATGVPADDFRLYPTGTYDGAPLPAAYSPIANYPPPSDDTVRLAPQEDSASPSGTNPRILNSRPKPQCWEHGCNGKTFSTFSNLLRHQREKSGTAAKSTCPNCGAEFTRTTAMKGHRDAGKCKPRNPNSISPPPRED
ncbi:hypothetical protein M011DRAFT_491215 [Sporormia fimetaria CBS 119925]|uniref:C2H2-type domain-containing protein n=1 Tax=Sporormia fimetaria CBS 119925 TaxID=1340428 RepID=A0A6A6VPS9_9PLEO|nr:hypothetical protein M011DRAFT_491215 [Sporormia fimetaria CBS 119925]